MKAASDAILQGSQATYLEGIEPARDELLAKMEELAEERGLPISDPEVASFLAVTVGAMATRPLSILELGTNIGYGAVALARAAGPGSRVVTVELDEGLCAEARTFVAKAGLAERVEVVQGAALEVLATLPGPFDVAYVDCVKEEYPEYFEAIVPRLAPHGVLIADNVLWRGLVARYTAGDEIPSSERRRVEALARFNGRFLADPRLRGVVLPLGDGVAFGVRRPT